MPTKKYLKNKSAKIERKKIKRKNRSKIRKFENHNNYISKRHNQLKLFESNYTPPKKATITSIFSPAVLTLGQKNASSTLKFISNIKHECSKSNRIDIRLDHVLEISNGAIIMLLGVIQDRKHFGINFTGSFPLHESSRESIYRSGFMDVVKTSQTAKSKINSNAILVSGAINKPPDELYTAVHKSMKCVWGIEGRCPLLCGAIIEMIRNTVDHAFVNDSRSKTWHFNVRFDNSLNKVYFAFSDQGSGIIETLVNKSSNVIRHLFDNNATLLYSAFESGTDSRTGHQWRGTGLRTIYELHEDGIVKNLTIISNNAYVSFERKTRVVLDESLSGTYYYWEIDLTCTKHVFK